MPAERSTIFDASLGGVNEPGTSEQGHAHPLGREDDVVLSRGQHRHRDRLERLVKLPVHLQRSRQRPHNLAEEVNGILRAGKPLNSQNASVKHGDMAWGR